MRSAPAIVDTGPIASNYASQLLCLRRGRGVWLWDINGNRYLDFGAGIAVNSLGYGRRDLARIAKRQMRRITHVSNLYITEQALRLADRLTGYRSAIGKRYDAVFFGNSGAEANEAALKFARLYAKERKGVGHHKLVCFEHAFHGRTMGALSLTPTPAYRDKFEPLLPGIISLPFNDSDALQEGLDPSVAAIIVEPIQGEGGMSTMTTAFADALNRACAEHDIILIADEIQTGLGRTGAIFASEWIGLAPDIITLSKPLAGGLPLSATLVTDRIDSLLNTGEHGTTFGGGPTTTAVASRVWDIISQPSFLERVRERAHYARGRLQEVVRSHRCVTGLRGAGLLLGLQICDEPDVGREWTTGIIEQARDRGLLLLRSGANVVRIAPPLIIDRRHLDIGIDIIDTIIREYP